MNSKQKTRRYLIILGIVAAVVTVIAILRSNYLLPWQLPLYKDRKAIIEYVREVHPDSKIAEEHIEFGPTPGGILSVQPDCYITFEVNGFQYRVFASNGKVFSDTYADKYAQMKLWSEVETFINDEFLEPRGIENVDIYCDFYNKHLLSSEWSEYNYSLDVLLSIYEQGSTPREVLWLYEFYEFWLENQCFSPKWSLKFDIYGTSENAMYDSSLYVSSYSNAMSAAEFYKRAYIPNKAN